MIKHLCRYLENEGLDIHAAEVIRNGSVIFHHCPEEDKRYPVYSVTKSLTSAAFSLACDDGLLTPETPLSDHLDTDIKMNEAFKAMPFSRFLTMTAGEYPFRPEGDDWLRFILSLDKDYSDTAYHYSNIPAYLVGRAVENAVGGDLMSYLDKRIFSPLAIEAPAYKTCPQGHFYGATGMELSVHELALLGLLYLNKGRFGGVSLISESSVSQALTPRVLTPAGDSYGYFFRIAEDHFSMVGKWGQRCMVYPGSGLVIAYLSDVRERPDALYELMKRFAADIISGRILQ